MKQPTLTTAALSALVASSLILAGCSSNDDTSATPQSTATLPTVEKVDSIAALVPDSISQDGKLAFGTDASYAPSEFFDVDGKTIIGFDVDLGKAVASVMGLEGTFSNSPFDALIPAVADSGKFEASMSSFTINEERLKRVNMISYFNAGTAWATATGNPSGVTQDDACGKKVAVQKGTVQAEDIDARSKKCVDEGKDAINIETYQLQADATTAVASGKVDAMLADSPVIAFAIKQTGDKLEQLGDIYDAAPYGAVVAKDQTDLAKAFQQAFQTIMDNGQYEQILEVWNVQKGAITTSEVNPTP